MSFANEGNSLSTMPIDKVKLLFDKSLRGNNNQRLRQIMLGENNVNSNSNGEKLMEPLLEDGGIVFDYTPSVTITYVTSYTPLDVVHSNYDFYAFQKAGVNDFQIEAPITSETREKANRTLAIIHFLRTFSKMNFGVDDDMKGLPPRILRLFGYGDYMINDVPVAIRNFSVVLGQESDYVQTDFNTQVPLSMRISINLHMMPTPSKIKNEFNLQDFAAGKTVKKGYL